MAFILDFAKKVSVIAGHYYYSYYPL